MLMTHALANLPSPSRVHQPLAKFDLRVAALHMQCKCSSRTGKGHTQELQGVVPMAAENRRQGAREGGEVDKDTY